MPVEECAFRVDSAAAKQVESEMLKVASCNGTGLTWPNATGLIGPCPAAKSYREMRLRLFQGVAVAILGALVMGVGIGIL
ncbi:hypothetical protein IFR05_002520 [Cadophora sp. M221]|nr:hypothetical protein IFR05_002520 [Cadophora sp. M221]